MFFSEFEDDPLENIGELWKQYLAYKANGGGYFSKEEALAIIEELDRLDKSKEAFEFVNDMTGFYPNCSSLKIKKADILISLDRVNDAKIILDQILDYETKEIDYFLLRIEAEIICNNDKALKGWIRQAEHDLAQDEYLDFIYELIEVLETYEMAELIFYCIASLSKKNQTMRTDLVSLLPIYTEKSGNYEECIDLAHQIIQESPYSIHAWMSLGIAYSGVKMYEKAIDAYQYALAIKPKRKDVLPKIASCFIKNRKIAEAKEYLLEYLESHPKDVATLRSLGFCCTKQKQYSLARYYLENALQIQPTDHTILIDIAQTYLDSKKYAEALNILNRTLLLTNKIPYYHYLIGYCCFEVGNFNTSIKYYSLAISVNPKKKEYWEGLLKALVKIKDFDQLYTLSLKALQHTQKQYFLYYLAFAEYKLEKKNASFQTLDRAISNSPRQYRKINSFIPLEEIKNISSK